MNAVFKLNGKKGQMTIFVIVAIVLVAGIGLYFAFRGSLSGTSVPAELSPVYDYYSSCISDSVKSAIDMAGSQGGRLYTDTYIPGSEYAPFSNQLNFLGFPVPYWYYVSGNGIIKEQVPTKLGMEGEIARYVESRLRNCNFDKFVAQGFSVNLKNSKATAKISDLKVDVSVQGALEVSKGDVSSAKDNHAVSVNSKLGKFFNMANQIYDKEKKEAFLESYAVDVLRLYAPVDGVEIQCSPKIWKTREVINDIKEGLVANINSLKFDGNYYELNNQENKYFVIDQSVDENVNVLYSKDWASKIEVFGAEDELMIANPVGNQQGLGIMGFCYAPYHFVYDLSFPVMIQIMSGDEIFQFPMVVVIDKNVPRKAIFSEFVDSESVNLCGNINKDFSANVYDINLNKVDANLSFECFNERCSLGETNGGKFVGKVPACVNGYLVASAEGYATNRRIISTNSQSSAEIILDKEKEMNVEVRVGGKPLSGTAIVSFEGRDIRTIALPENNKLKVSEGLYNISVFVYGNSSLSIPGSTKRQCTEVASSGIAGLFGGTREECFDIAIPETKIDYALVGGGKSEQYILASDLNNENMVIDVEDLPVPSSIEDLQNNFQAFEGNNLEVSFK